jgi:hypothetical protein
MSSLHEAARHGGATGQQHRQTSAQEDMSCSIGRIGFRPAAAEDEEVVRVGQLVEFALQDGTTVLVEVDSEAGGPVTRGLGDRRIVQQAQQTFEQAISRVQPAAELLVRRLRLLADVPDEVQVEFGLELSAEAGAFIAAASSTANFRVSLTWRRSANAGPSVAEAGAAPPA